MGIRWWRRRARRAAGEEAATASRADTAVEDDVTTDLRDRIAAIHVTASPRSAAGSEADRERRARVDAVHDLRRLRARHWSGERVIEEARLGVDFWEHDEADPYAVLSLLPGATLEEAAAARRRIAQECHPDRLPEGVDPSEAIRRMTAANAAYDRLRRALRPL
jgi:hypothetical protein